MMLISPRSGMFSLELIDGFAQDDDDHRQEDVCVQDNAIHVSTDHLVF